MAKNQPTGYVVVRLGSDQSPESVALDGLADEIAAYHHAAKVQLARETPRAGVDEAMALMRLQMHPRTVLFVLPPDMLDVDFHRRRLLEAAQPDGLFCRYDFGYFTARDAAATRALWDRTKQVLEHGLPDKRIVTLSVASGMKGTVYPESGSGMEKAAGWSGPAIYLPEVENDAAALAWSRDHLSELQTASMIHISGNGDPLGIWLFDGNRNRDRSKHWEFDPARIGEDPKGEMPRLLASDFAGLKLSSPVVWSGTCHCAVVGTAYIENDIVSTFGRVTGPTAWRLRPDQSLALTWISDGAVAVIAPIGPNHGFSTILESDFALASGASLGETIRHTYDDVMLAAATATNSPGNQAAACARQNRRLSLSTDKGGGTEDDNEQVMQGGGANRILIGDPALRPFTPTPDPREKVQVLNAGSGGLEVLVRRDKGFIGRAWDMYGDVRTGEEKRSPRLDGRIGARVDVTNLKLPAGAKLGATVVVTDAQGNQVPMLISRCVLEDFHGARWLHLQANGDRKALGDRELEAKFAVRVIEK